MTTIFEKLTEYQSKNEVPPLTHIQKSSLGRNIATYWYSVPTNPKLTFVISKEDTGTFKVLAYPDSFGDKLYELIGIFYNSLKRRRRTPIKKVVWNAKPSNNNNNG